MEDASFLGLVPGEPWSTVFRTMTAKPTVHVGARVPLELATALERVSALESRTVSEELRVLMRRRVDEAHNDSDPSRRSPGRAQKSAARGRHDQS